MCSQERISFLCFFHFQIAHFNVEHPVLRNSTLLRDRDRVRQFYSFLQCESTDNNLDITQEKEDYESDNFSLESHLQLFEPFEGISVEIQTNEVDFLDEIPHKIIEDTDSDDSGVETEGWFPTLYS